MILHRGKIVTVDREFSVREAIAVRGGRIARVGSNEEVLQLRGPWTEVVDLGGKMVLGLMDSYTHPSGAAMTEFDHRAGDGVDCRRAAARADAAALPDGAWIQVRQVFITRLREQRYPDPRRAGPEPPPNPVVFSTGPDASVNSLALRRWHRPHFESGGRRRREDREDPATGEPTGILRRWTRFVKPEPSGKQATEADRYRRTLELFRDYVASGITAVGPRRRPGRHPALLPDARAGRTAAAAGDLAPSAAKGRSPTQRDIREVAGTPLRAPIRCSGSSASRRFWTAGCSPAAPRCGRPWGVSEIYSITDPRYWGVLFIPPDRLLQLVRATVKAGMQFTAHSVGDGAVHNLLDAYEAVNRETPVRRRGLHHPLEP